VLLHRALAVLVLPATLLLPTGVGAAAPTTTAATLPPPCTGTSWVAGSVDLCDGRLVYRDDVYDEGADIGHTSGTQKAFGPPAAPAGDVRYPAGAVTTADLVRLEAGTRTIDRQYVELRDGRLVLDTSRRSSTARRQSCWRSPWEEPGDESAGGVRRERP